MAQFLMVGPVFDLTLASAIHRRVAGAHVYRFVPAETLETVTATVALKQNRRRGRHKRNSRTDLGRHGASQSAIDRRDGLKHSN
jgi:hypothetical protein